MTFSTYRRLTWSGIAHSHQIGRARNGHGPVLYSPTLLVLFTRRSTERTVSHVPSGLLVITRSALRRPCDSPISR
ncbi:MAG TPA: hypothetical protein VG815_10285, partial [Chloroflexota bacterium]|nr:hypothetical protein [Chloroflexota bacterium]